MAQQEVEPSEEWLGYLWYEIKSRARSGIFADSGFLYIFFTAIGVGVASYQIPKSNGSEISPETLGIYVIGFLVSAGLDALLVLMKPGSGDHDQYGRAIAKLFLMISVALALCAWPLSLHTTPDPATQTIATEHVVAPHQAAASEQTKQWFPYAGLLLSLILLIGLLMSLILAGGDGPKKPKVGSLNRNTNDITDKE